MNYRKLVNFSIVNEELHLNNQDLDNCLLDETTLPKYLRKVFIHSHKPIDLLIKYSQNFDQLEYEVCANVQGKINQLFEHENINIKRDFIMRKNSNIDFSTADFDRYHRKFKIDVVLEGDRSNAQWLLSALTKHNYEKMYDISFIHKGRASVANMINYGVIVDASTLTFSGVNLIGEDVRQCESHQTAKIIIFDDKAKAKADPILIIHNNDVVAASHAATMGTVNSEHMFYMQSRGISEKETKKIITYGYLEPVIKKFEDESIQLLLNKQLSEAI